MTHGWHRSLSKIQKRIRVHLYQGSMKHQGAREAAEATAKAAESQQQAGAAGSISGQYLANTVLFAAVLFFANAAGRFEQRRVRVVAFAFAVSVFLFALGRTAMLPLSS